MYRGPLDIVLLGGDLYRQWPRTVQISLSRGRNPDKVCSLDLCGHSVRECRTEPAGGRVVGSAGPVCSRPLYILCWQGYHPTVCKSTAARPVSLGRCIHAGCASLSSAASWRGHRRTRCGGRVPLPFPSTVDLFFMHPCMVQCTPSRALRALCVCAANASHACLAYVLLVWGDCSGHSVSLPHTLTCAFIFETLVA